jgi:hypothetical protein
MSQNNNQNALKHGVFSKTLILLKEDPKEFEELHKSLVSEWNAEGPTQLDAVMTLATSMWRKRRIGQWRLGQMEKFIRVDGRLERKNDRQVDRVVTFLEETRSAVPGSITEECLQAKLGKNIADDLKRIAPRAKYKTDDDWLKVICSKLDDWIVRNVILGDELEKLEDIYSDDDFISKELALEERLDAQIDRAIKRLIQTKTVKEIFSRNSRPSVTNEPLKLVESPAVQAAGDEERNTRL